MKEKKARVEDALHATRAAVEEGIVAGGGVALLRARAVVKVVGDNADQDAGVKIVLRAIEEPLRAIVANAGDEPSVVVARVLEGKGNFGYNAANLLMGGFKPEEISVMYMKDAGLEHYGNALLVSPAFMRDNPDAVRRFIRASIRGFLDVAANPAEGIAAAMRRIGGTSCPEAVPESLRSERSSTRAMSTSTRVDTDDFSNSKPALPSGPGIKAPMPPLADELRRLIETRMELEGLAPGVNRYRPVAEERCDCPKIKSESTS
jgi:hypothetical protein